MPKTTAAAPIPIPAPAPPETPFEPAVDKDCDGLENVGLGVVSLRVVWLDMGWLLSEGVELVEDETEGVEADDELDLIKLVVDVKLL